MALFKDDTVYLLCRRIYNCISNKYNFILKILYYLKYKIFKNKMFGDMNKPRILYVSFITGGGLKKHIYELSNGSNICENFDVWMFLGNGWIVHNGSKFLTSLSIGDILIRIDPSIIHIHQLSKTLDEYDVIPWESCIITTHDLYYVCPHFFMVECFNKFCHPSNCNEEWREKMHLILKRCKCIVCPSRSVKDILTFYYPDISGKITIIEHGI